MQNIQKYEASIKFLKWILFIGLFLTGNCSIFVLVYVFICAYMLLRALFSPAENKVKIILMISYAAIMVVQLVYTILVTYGKDTLFLVFCISKLFSTAMVMIPLVVEKIFTVYKHPDFHLPSVQDLSVVSFAELKNSRNKILSAVDVIDKTGKMVNKESLNEIISDLPRHNSFRYIANGSLTNEYFEQAEESLTDPHIYIVISNTGSAASELISLFTQKQYNHASLSFDRDLRTIISYNGGERVYPPGLNHEMVTYFNKKQDSSIIVYRLQATPEQKRKIIEKVKEINEEGSAYNLMGLIFKYSHKPNIMFCSQFVYKMLQYADLTYFHKKDGDVKPTDLVELDYHRKLQFAYEMHLNGNDAE